MVPNPAYDRWYDQDQHILSGLLSPITEDILLDVVSASTAKEAWDTLEHMFSSTVRARTIQVRVDLATTKKREYVCCRLFPQDQGLCI